MTLPEDSSGLEAGESKRVGSVFLLNLSTMEFPSFEVWGGYRKGKNQFTVSMV